MMTHQEILEGRLDGIRGRLDVVNKNLVILTWALILLPLPLWISVWKEALLRWF